MRVSRFAISPIWRIERLVWCAALVLELEGSALPLSYKGMCGWAGLDLNQRRIAPINHSGTDPTHRVSWASLDTIG